MNEIKFNRSTGSQVITTFNGISILIDKVSENQPEAYNIYCKVNNFFSLKGSVTFRAGVLKAEYYPKNYIAYGAKTVYQMEINSTADDIILEHMKMCVQMIASALKVDISTK